MSYKVETPPLFKHQKIDLIAPTKEHLAAKAAPSALSEVRNV
jgi:hypothetical protein